MAANDYRMAPQEVQERAYGYALQAVNLAPNKSLPVSTLGYVQILLSEYDAAEANITRGLMLNPSKVGAMMDMATMQLVRCHLDEALLWLDKIEEINPLRYQYLCRTHRSEAFYMLREYNSAANELKFIKSLPQQQGLKLAAALAKAGFPERQIGHFADAYEFFPLYEFIAWLKQEETQPAGTAYGAELLTVEVTGTVAIAKLTDTCFGSDFTDYLVMLKDRPDASGRWQNVTKAYHVHSGRGLPPDRA